MHNAVAANTTQTSCSTRQSTTMSKAQLYYFLNNDDPVLNTMVEFLHRHCNYKNPTHNACLVVELVSGKYVVSEFYSSGLFKHKQDKKTNTMPYPEYYSISQLSNAYDSIQQAIVKYNLESVLAKDYVIPSLDLPSTSINTNKVLHLLNQIAQQDTKAVDALSNYVSQTIYFLSNQMTTSTKFEGNALNTYISSNRAKLLLIEQLFEEVKDEKLKDECKLEFVIYICWQLATNTPIYATLPEPDVSLFSMLHRRMACTFKNHSEPFVFHKYWNMPKDSPTTPTKVWIVSAFDFCQNCAVLMWALKSKLMSSIVLGSIYHYERSWNMQLSPPTEDSAISCSVCITHANMKIDEKLKSELANYKMHSI